MKILKLNTSKPLHTTKKWIRTILSKEPDAFKSTRWQFLRNNQAYNPAFSGLIA